VSVFRFGGRSVGELWQKRAHYDCRAGGITCQCRP
jgi:hypothetical protein